MDQRPHTGPSGGASIPEQGTRQAPFYYDYPSMGAMPPPVSFATASLQAPAYYPPPQHAPLLDAGGLGDPTCGVAAAMWNGAPANPYGSPSSSSSYTSGGAHPSYYAGYDYYMCNNLAYYPPANLTSPGALPTGAPAPDYQHTATTQLAHSVSSPPYCFTPHLSSLATSNGNEHSAMNGVNSTSAELQHSLVADNRRPLFHATTSSSQMPFSSEGGAKVERQLLTAPANHLQQFYLNTVDSNAIVNSMQQMSLHSSAAAVNASSASASVVSQHQHPKFKSGLSGPPLSHPHQDASNGPRRTQPSHPSPSSQATTVQNVNSQQSRSLGTNAAQYMAAVTSNSGSSKSWACIAGQPPRGSAATLGNSIVSGLGASAMLNGNGYSVNPSPEEELTSHVGTKEDATNAVQRQQLHFSSSVFNGREQQPQAPTPPGHSHFHRQNGTSLSATDYSYPSRPTAYSEANSFGPYSGSYPITSSLTQQSQPCYPSLGRGTNVTQMPPATAPFTAHETSSYNLEEAKKLLSTLHVSLNRPDFDFEAIKLARVFVIKSFSEEDVHRSMKYGVWCSTERGNERLNAAYLDMQARGGRVFLCFSVNGSGHFCGFCEMISPVNMEKRCGIWADPRWRGELRVQWHFVKDVPNSELRHIRVETNENKSVTNSRDCTEVTPLEKGQLLMRLIAKFKHRTCFLDDFLHYEMKEIDTRANNQLISNARS